MNIKSKTTIITFILFLAFLDAISPTKAALSYYLAIQEGDEAIYEITVVNTTGMEATFGANWKDRLDPGESSTVGGQLKKIVRTITNETNYWTVDFLISTWTTGDFTSQLSSQKVYTDPSEAQGSSLLMALSVIDYMKNAVFPLGAYVKDNVVTYELTSLLLYNVTYTFSVEHGLRTKFQFIDINEVVIYEYVLSSYDPKAVIPFGDSFSIISLVSIATVVLLSKRKINRS